MPLTDAACKNATCPTERPRQRFTDSGGLYLEISKTGAKLWRWKFRFAGKEKLLALGAYPSVPLSSARKARDAARLELSSGADPSATKRAARRIALAKADTAFEKIAYLWWNDWKINKAERHATYVITRLKADAFPAIGAKPIADLTAPAFVHLAKSIEARGAADIARRVLQTCAQIMRYAVAHGLAERNPVADVKPGDVLRSRRQVNFARVDVSEIPDLMRKIAGYRGTHHTRFALQLMALTFVRTGELIGARWQEFDLQHATWRIPAERTKARREHLVPLSRQAVEVLRTLKAVSLAPDACTGSVLLFPGERDHQKPISNNTLLKALQIMGYKGRMTGHGFRGLASTALNEMGFRPDVIEAQLAHIEENRVRAAYNHARYRTERQQLMQAWADYLDAVRDPDAGTRLRRADKRAEALPDAFLEAVRADA